MDIHEIINKIYPMPESSVDKLKRLLSKVTYPKGHLILETGKTETNLFFIEKGIARAYIPVDGKEVTFWIGREGSTIVSLKSYVNNQQGYETVELMENSVLYMLKRKELYELFEEDIHIANWGTQICRNRIPANRGKAYLPPVYNRIRTLQGTAERQSGFTAKNAAGMPRLLSGNHPGKP